ncbi:hypothetical protein QYM36_008371 [Artemia franciscana]|uniref:RNA-directed DNA polymerase from transposon X-element n=1 Tax=Artemia franciscana TaxID=6661 RepID=A0AA88LLF0_ARTSF|nr:hypothetical protein QYM36_008371 [Artemia franciscana]
MVKAEKNQSDIKMTKIARTSPDKETSPDKGGDFNLHNKKWDTSSQQDQQSFAFADYTLEPDSNLCLITPRDLGTRLNVTNDNNKQPQIEPITIDELETPIKKIKPRTPGPDQIHNLMLKNLPEEAKNILLILFNKSIKEAYTPKEWRKTSIIPIPKTGKDSSNQ